MSKDKKALGIRSVRLKSDQTAAHQLQRRKIMPPPQVFRAEQVAYTRMRKILQSGRKGGGS